MCRHLERSRIKGTAIHSNRTQAQRQRALDGFKDGTYRVLVATDIVARGIDVDRISHVINYDLPAQWPRTTCTASAARPAPAPPARPSASWPPSRRTSCATSSCMLGQPLPCQDLDGFAYMQRLVPDPERVARKPKPRLVYNGSARRRSR